MSILIRSISDEAFLSALSRSSILLPSEVVSCEGGGTDTGADKGRLLLDAHEDSAKLAKININLAPDCIWVL